MKWSRYNTLFYSDKIGYCLFNSRMMSLTKMDRTAYGILTTISNTPEEAEKLLSKDDYNTLRIGKVLVSDNEDENYINMLKYKKQVESYSSKSLGIVVCPTLSCNFACPYCYEEHTKTSVMNDTVQDQLIEFINDNAQENDNLILNWHGGEPLIAFNTIKNIYSKIESKSILPIGHSSMVSNGYLLNSEICTFLEEKQLDYLQITIDGKESTHNKTRFLRNGAPTYWQIVENIDMALELMPNCHIGIRTNIGPRNHGEYVELHQKLSNRWKGKNCSVYHAYVTDNGLNSCISRRLAIELTTKERNDFEVNLAKHGIISKESLYPTLDKGTYTCMDNKAFVIDPQCLIYKCWADVGMKSRSIGNLSEGITNYGIVAQYMVGTDKFSDDKCLKCSYLPICDGGCNLYRVGFIEKGVPYNTCCIDRDGLIKYLECYCENR